MTRRGSGYHLLFLAGGLGLSLAYLTQLRAPRSGLEIVTTVAAATSFWVALGALLRLPLTRLRRSHQTVVATLLLTAAGNLLLLEHLSRRILGVFFNRAILELWFRHPSYSAFLVYRTLPGWFVPVLAAANLAAVAVVAILMWRTAVPDDAPSRRRERGAALAVLASSLGVLLVARLALAPELSRRVAALGPELARVLPTESSRAGVELGPSRHPDLFPPDQVRRGRPGSPPDIVMVVIDGVNPNHLGCEGYTRDLSPNLDRLAASGRRFPIAYAQASSTIDGITALLESRYPFTGQDPLSHPFLNALDERGYSIGVFSSQDDATMQLEQVMANELVDHHTDSTDAKSIIPHEASWGEKSDDRETIDNGITWLGSTTRPFFAFFYLQATHYPYHVPAGFARFEPYAASVDLLHFDAAAAERLTNAYDNALGYADHQIGRLLAAVADSSPGAIIVVTADHGESLGRHGNAIHGWSVFEDDVRIPLIIAGSHPLPPLPDGFAELVDVAPTVLALAGVAYRESDFDGFDLFTAPEIARHTAFFHMNHGLRRVGGARHRELKLMSYLDQNWDALYDLSVDPGEVHDLAKRRPDDLTAMWRLFNQWRLWRGAR